MFAENYFEFTLYTKQLHWKSKNPLGQMYYCSNDPPLLKRGTISLLKVIHLPQTQMEEKVHDYLL